MPKSIYNFSTPQKCLDGFFCAAGSANPEGSGPCPTGYYCPNPSEAIACPEGHFCPGIANVFPIECLPGTYQPSIASSNCTLCPKGHICPGWGRITAELCPAGFVCVSSGLSASVLLCPPGYWCAEGTRTLDPYDNTTTTFRPLPCPAGTFCLGGVARNFTIDWLTDTGGGHQAPQACLEGTFCGPASVSSQGSGPCLPGHYCPPGSEMPLQTPMGNFAPSEGSIVPQLCFPGTYTAMQVNYGLSIVLTIHIYLFSTTHIIFFTGHTEMPPLPCWIHLPSIWDI